MIVWLLSRMADNAKHWLVVSGAPTHRLFVDRVFRLKNGEYYAQGLWPICNRIFSVEYTQHGSPWSRGLNWTSNSKCANPKHKRKQIHLKQFAWRERESFLCLLRWLYRLSFCEKDFIIFTRSTILLPLHVCLSVCVCVCAAEDFSPRGNCMCEYLCVCHILKSDNFMSKCFPGDMKQHLSKKPFCGRRWGGEYSACNSLCNCIHSTHSTPTHSLTHISS